MGKVLLPLYQIQDYGGIINWVEHLCHGLKAIGKEPVLVRLEDKLKLVNGSSSRITTLGHSGLRSDQRAGWMFPIDRRVALRGVDWKRYTAGYEAVVWVVPVPSAVRLPDDWQRLYDIKPPQVMVIHDGNLPKLYPHATEVMPRMAGVVGVHDCALATIPPEHPRHLIPNPQVKRITPIGYNLRGPAVISLQTFKRWKRVDDLVRAVPHMTSGVLLAGGGIEYHYMTSAGKRKPEYGGIWEEACTSGMEYLGYISEGERDRRMARCRVLFDPSWSRTYAGYGSHFNRTFVDGIIAGLLPAGRELLMDGNSFFDPTDYVTIPHDAPPEQVANELDRAVTTPRSEYERRVLRLRGRVWANFCSLVVAKRYAGLWGG